MQPTWGSYEDAAHTTPRETFNSSYRTAYMFGESFNTGNYTVGFYDGAGARVTDVSGTFASGNLSAEYLLSTNMTSKEGTWHAVVFNDAQGSPPATYAAANATAGYLVEDDFTVDSSAMQPTWESYDDAVQSNVWGTVGDPYTDTTQTAYMYGQGFAAGTYAVGFYDNAGDKAGSDVSGTFASGNLSAQFALNTDPTGAEGTWHAVVFDTALGSPSANYTATSGAAGYVTEDDFEVNASAIPEIPTVLAAIGVAMFCFGIYYWMRRRRLAYVQA